MSEVILNAISPTEAVLYNVDQSNFFYDYLGNIIIGLFMLFFPFIYTRTKASVDLIFVEFSINFEGYLFLAIWFGSAFFFLFLGLFQFFFGIISQMIKRNHLEKNKSGIDSILSIDQPNEQEKFKIINNCNIDFSIKEMQYKYQSPYYYIKNLPLTWMRSFIMILFVLIATIIPIIVIYFINKVNPGLVVFIFLGIVTIFTVRVVFSTGKPTFTANSDIFTFGIADLIGFSSLKSTDYNFRLSTGLTLIYHPWEGESLLPTTLQLFNIKYSSKLPSNPEKRIELNNNNIIIQNENSQLKLTVSKLVPMPMKNLILLLKIGFGNGHVKINEDALFRTILNEI